MKNVIEGLVACMTTLSDSELKNLKHHRKAGTGILSGAEAGAYSCENGCGCPAMLASTKRVHKKCTNDLADGVYAKANIIYRRLDDDNNTADGNTFFDLLEAAKPAQVGEAVDRVLELRGI